MAFSDNGSTIGFITANYTYILKHCIFLKEHGGQTFHEFNLSDKFLYLESQLSSAPKQSLHPSTTAIWAYILEIVRHISYAYKK